MTTIAREGCPMALIPGNEDHRTPELDLDEVGTRRPQLLSYTQVAEEYGIKVGTLYAMVHQRRIPHVRLGRRFVRFSRHELERWIDSNNVTPTGGR